MQEVITCPSGRKYEVSIKGHGETKIIEVYYPIKTLVSARHAIIDHKWVPITHLMSHEQADVLQGIKNYMEEDVPFDYIHQCSCDERWLCETPECEECIDMVLDKQCPTCEGRAWMDERLAERKDI